MRFPLLPLLVALLTSYTYGIGQVTFTTLSSLGPDSITVEFDTTGAGMRYGLVPDSLSVANNDSTIFNSAFISVPAQRGGSFLDTLVTTAQEPVIGDSMYRFRPVGWNSSGDTTYGTLDTIITVAEQPSISWAVRQNLSTIGLALSKSANTPKTMIAIRDISRGMWLSPEATTSWSADTLWYPREDWPTTLTLSNLGTDSTYWYKAIGKNQDSLLSGFGDSISVSPFAGDSILLVYFDPNSANYLNRIMRRTLLLDYEDTVKSWIHDIAIDSTDTVVVGTGLNMSAGGHVLGSGILSATGGGGSSVTLHQRINQYYEGMPPDSSDLLTWYFSPYTGVSVKGLHIQATEPSSDTAIFLIGDSLGGLGSTFPCTLFANQPEGLTVGQSLDPTDNWIYVRSQKVFGSAGLNFTLIAHCSTSTYQRINRYFSGIPPSAEDILTFYFPTSSGLFITGAHMQVQKAPTSAATFRVGNALAGGGTGFNVTVGADSLEGYVTGQSITPSAGYVFLRSVTPYGCGDINITLLLEQ